VYKCLLCLSLIPIRSVFATGWTDYSTNLVGGYELLRTNACSIMIYRDGSGFVVPPKVVGLNVRGDIVFGKVEDSPCADFSSVPGFFVLNTKSGVVRTGLDKRSWLSVLKGHGITKEPPLREPSRFFMLKLYKDRLFKLLPLVTCVVLAILITYVILEKSHKRRRSGKAASENPTCLYRPRVEPHGKQLRKPIAQGDEEKNF